ncbi:amidohydrolase family protein [Nocardia sp. alder85J]|uniref:amidohydrolase family protein n=1 Tax=Nocardia sp. alder85J TaxID=2862949 RepID=UPI001CD232B5|nr:amidohydrolase family protein [Nocardia sp. alder85J]MCX4095598.1 amidohydrolase family protein [Nocardia sp. alder85J]
MSDSYDANAVITPEGVDELPRTYRVISVDDHLCEPPDMFEGRLPAKFQDRAPRVVEQDNGDQVWTYENRVFPNIAVNAVVGLPKEKWGYEPVRFDKIRKGSWDIHARIADMDLAGIEASLCFPSQVAGFGGVTFADSEDKELGLAVTRAWNDWHAEVWAGSYPDRIIPLQLPWLPDPVVAAEEVRKNAARGFRAVTFPEYPTNVGYPSFHTNVWDPFFAACEETDTVVCIHTGSGRWAPLPPNSEGPRTIRVSLFPVNAMVCCADLLWSEIPVRFPNLKIALAEGGIGWVAMYLDRLEYMETRAGSFGNEWSSKEISPAEVVRRNFYFCSLDDPSTISTRDRIGLDHIMMEVDYPHADSTWPDTQKIVHGTLGGLPENEIEAITHGNAERLFRFPLAKK